MCSSLFTQACSCRRPSPVSCNRPIRRTLSGPGSRSHRTGVRSRPDPPSDPALQFLDPGERAAITLALSLDADRLLIDEWEGRAEAERRHLFVTGTLGIPAEAHQQGLLDFEAALTRLRQTNFYYVGGTRQPRPSAAIDRERGSVIVGPRAPADLASGEFRHWITLTISPSQRRGPDR